MADEKRQKYKTKSSIPATVLKTIGKTLSPFTGAAKVVKAMQKEVNRQKQKGEHKEINVFKSKKAKGGRITKSKGGRAR